MLTRRVIKKYSNLSDGSKKLSSNTTLKHDKKSIKRDSSMYITQEQLDGFDSYKYNSVDDSPLSKYVFHPFWNKFMLLVPPKIAPNTLTVCGFLFSISQFLLLTHFDPVFQASTSQRTPGSNDGFGHVPKWVWIYCAIAQFLAHTLDGVDGKQARKTGCTGPLGELMDHGIDAWSCCLILTSLFSVIGYSPNGQMSDGITMVDMVSFTFYTRIST